jgi:hypothetical protein
MRNVIAVVLALFAPLLFPWPLAAVIAFLVSCVLPPLGLLSGVVADTLYYTHAVGIPYATIAGALATCLGFLVHEFWRTRIMAA